MAGGGGGRIAIWGDVSPGMQRRWIAGENVRVLHGLTNWPGYTGTISVAYGTGYTNIPPGAAVTWTVFLIRYLKLRGTTLSVGN